MFQGLFGPVSRGGKWEWLSINAAHPPLSTPCYDRLVQICFGIGTDPSILQLCMSVQQAGIFANTCGI